MAKERTCMICGATYEFCNHCREFENQPGWKVLYHDGNCKKIGDLWYAYRGKEMSKEEARKAMSAFKPNIDNALKYTGTIAAMEIREIFDIKEEVAEERQPKEEAPVVTEKISKRRNPSKKENKESV